MTSKDQMRRCGLLLRQERLAVGSTLEQLARAIGCSKAQLSLMESGQRTISIERAQAIEKALKIRDGRLVNAIRWHNTPPEIRRRFERSEEDRRSMRLGIEHAFDQRDAQKTIKEIRKLARSANDSATDASLPFGQGRSIPLINTIAAGYPREFTDLKYPKAVADEYVACPDVTDPDAFAARVVGDAMEPEYRQGDIVVFAPMLKPTSGSDCFVRFKLVGPTTFCRVYFESDKKTIRLQPLNSAHPPRFVDRKNVAGLYPAEYVMRRVKHGANA